MLRWGFIFLIIAIVAGLLGFTGVAGAASMAAKIVFGVALVVFLLALIIGKAVLSGNK